LRPADWPLSLWVALTLAASFVRLDYTIGDYSGATGMALFAGATVGARRGARIQAAAALALVPLALVGVLGSLTSLGYIVGRIAAAWAAGRSAAISRPPATGWSVRLPLVLLLAVAAWSTRTWHEPPGGLNLRMYYTGVIGMGVLIGFWYAMRLVARPARVPALVAALAPYYILGIGWVAVCAWAWPALLPLPVSEIPFHGLAVHLPGDVLTAVVVAFFLEPRVARRRLGSR